MGDIKVPKIQISFSPAWWHQRYGMDFGDQRRWLDPVIYTEWDREQRRLLYERFGDVGLGEKDPEPLPRAGEEYGHRWMSAFWGCEIQYFPDQAPHAVPLPDAEQRLATLTVPDVESSPVALRTLANARILENRYGHCRPAINYGGPLNNAVSVLGEAIYAICARDAALAQQVLYQMGQAIMSAHDCVACRIAGVSSEEAHGGDWAIGNCPVCTLSPAMYRKLVLPVDLWFREQFRGSFNLHHCGIFHPYREVYKTLKPETMDLGPGTDLRLARAAYPESIISVWIDVGSLPGMSAAQMDALIARVIEEAGPPAKIGWIGVAEVGPDLPDEKVRSWMSVGQRLRL